MRFKSLRISIHSARSMPNSKREKWCDDGERPKCGRSEGFKQKTHNSQTMRGEEDHPRRSRRRRPVYYDDDVEGCDADSCSSSHCSSPRRTSSRHLPQHIPLDDYGPDQDEGRLFDFFYGLVYAVVHTALTACVNFLDSRRKRRRKRRRNSNTNLNSIDEEANPRPRSFRPPPGGTDDIESGMDRGEPIRHDPEWRGAPSAPMTPPILKQPSYGPAYGHPADVNRRVHFPPPPNKQHLPIQGVAPPGYDAGLKRSRPPLGRIHSFGTASTCSVSTASTCSSSLGSSSAGSASSTRSYRSSTCLPAEVHSSRGSHRSSRGSDHTASGRRTSDLGRYHSSSNDLLRRREGESPYEPRRNTRWEGSSRPSGQRALALEPVFGHSKFAQGGARRNHGSMLLD